MPFSVLTPQAPGPGSCLKSGQHVGTRTGPDPAQTSSAKARLSAQGPSRFLPGWVTSSSAAAHPRPLLASPTALGRAPFINGNRLIPVPHPDHQGTIPTRPCPRPRGLCGAPCPRDTQVHLDSDLHPPSPALLPPRTASSSTHPSASFLAPDPPTQLFPLMVAAAVFPWLQGPLG